MTAGRAGRIRAVWRGVAAAYAPGLIDRFPAVRVRLGLWVPALVIRVAAAAVATACLGIVTGAIAAHGTIWTVFAVTAVAMVCWPARMLPPLVAMAIGVLAVLLVTPLDLAETATLILGLPGIALLGGLGGQVGALSRVELTTLVPLLRRLALIQLVSQPLGLLAGLISGATLSLTLLPVLAIAGLALLVILWMPTLE